jgi:uncharacterized LabA/DUF88 family protein
MPKKLDNYAFIDSQNLNLGVQSLGWKLDFQKFRAYLKDKYQVEKAFMFIGYIEGNNTLYQALQETGYICIFRPTLVNKDGSIKGNCDAEMVLHTMIEYPNYQKAVIITGDGDFQCLAKYLLEQKKLLAIIIPNRKRFSALLKFDIFLPYLRFMNGLDNKLAYKKKRPHKDKTL